MINQLDQRYSINTNREADQEIDDDNSDSQSTASYAADGVYLGTMEVSDTSSSFSDLNEQLGEFIQQSRDEEGDGLK